MPSRSGTAALQSQPAPILKPSTSHTRHSQSRTSRQQTRQTSRRGETRGETAATSETYVTERTRASRETGQTGESQRTGGRKSQYSRLRTARSKDDGDGDNVKTDDIWNKFVTDDGDVVKPPTAESVKSRHTGSQRSRLTGSQNGSKIDEEDDEEEDEDDLEDEDDDRTIYSDYYLPPAYERNTGTPEIRAEIVDAHEACSCFPDRSSKHLSSMLYDKIVCQHTGITGETQSGVSKFNPYWNENMEIPRKLRKRDVRISKTKFIMGYPRPKFEIMSESEEEGDEDEESAPEDKDADDRKTTTGGKSSNSKAGMDDDDGDDDDDDDNDDDDDEDDDEDEEDEDYLPFELPQIGYPHTPSPPASSQSGRSRRSVYDDDDDDDDDDDNDYSGRFPTLPASRQLTAQTAHSKRTGITQRTQRTQFTLPSRKAETRRSTKTAKTSKSKSKSGKADDKALDRGYDEMTSRQSNESRQSLPLGPIISTTRTFQGKFYDPVTKQMMLYDIGTRPGERLPVGILEPLYKPPTVQSEKPTSKPTVATGSKAGSRASQRSQKPSPTSSNR